MKTAQELAIIAEEARKQAIIAAERTGDILLENVIAGRLETTAGYGGNTYTFKLGGIDNLTREAIIKKLVALGYTFKKSDADLIIKW